MLIDHLEVVDFELMSWFNSTAVEGSLYHRQLMIVVDEVSGVFKFVSDHSACFGVFKSHETFP